MKDNHMEPVAQEKVLEVKNLRTSFFTMAGEVKAVNDVSYDLNKHEVIAIVGESGCGKTVLQLSVLNLIPTPPGKILGGEVLFEGNDLLKYAADAPEIRAVRGAKIAMVFQEPMTSLNPVYTVGNQLIEVIRTHRPKLSKKDAYEVGVESLKAVSIPEPEERMRSYPFQMSGGMKQRVMIATAIACHSKILIADEPTAALDVTTQAQIMDLLMATVDELKTSMVMVTHNLGLITRYASRVYVMYAGRVIESGFVEDILLNPQHPYTQGLLKSVPTLTGNKDEDLVPIPGTAPMLHNLPDQCAFMSRCPFVRETCKTFPFPSLQSMDQREHCVACHLYS